MHSSADAIERTNFVNGILMALCSETIREQILHTDSISQRSVEQGEHKLMRASPSQRPNDIVVFEKGQHRMFASSCPTTEHRNVRCSYLLFLRNRVHQAA